MIDYIISRAHTCMYKHTGTICISTYQPSMYAFTAAMTSSGLIMSVSSAMSSGGSFSNSCSSLSYSASPSVPEEVVIVDDDDDYG